MNFLQRLLRRLLGEPSLTAPREAATEDREIFEIVGDQVEPVIHTEEGKQLRAVVPGSRNDPFSALHKNDASSRLRAAVYHLDRGETEEAVWIIDRVLVEIESKPDD